MNRTVKNIRYFLSLFKLRVHYVYEACQAVEGIHEITWLKTLNLNIDCKCRFEMQVTIIH